MKTLTILATLLAFVGTAAAWPYDPDPDGMNIYFDEDATVLCVEEAPIFVGVPVYLVLTNPTTSQPHVLSWEAQVIYEGNAEFGIDANGHPQWTFAGGGLNLGQGADYIVGTANPPLDIDGPATVLATASLAFVAGEPGRAQFWVGRVTGSNTFPDGPGYTSEIGVSTPCHNIFDNNGWSCAWINPAYYGVWECPPLANEAMTWGEVKALY